MKRFFAASLLLLFIAATVFAARAKIPPRSADPYVGATVVRADNGEILIADRADALCYPASIVKLMLLLIVQEKIAAGSLRL